MILKKHNSSLFKSQIYQLKIKCKDGSWYFYKNKKYRLLEIEKKILLFHLTNS